MSACDLEGMLYMLIVLQNTDGGVVVPPTMVYIGRGHQQCQSTPAAVSEHTTSVLASIFRQLDRGAFSLATPADMFKYFPSCTSINRHSGVCLSNPHQPCRQGSISG